MATCADVLKGRADLLLAQGIDPDDLGSAICRAVDYIDGGDVGASIARARSTIWPQLSKQVRGGLTHVISADNPAGYAELWRDGDGNWYATTGATQGGTPLTKADLMAQGRRAWIYEIEGVYKGDSAERATALFLSKVFPLTLLKSSDCGCAAARRAREAQG